MHVVITGGTGFIGSKLCQKLLERNDRVTVLVRSIPEKKIDGVEYVPSNLLENLPTVLFECDVIIHLAGASIFEKWTKEYKQLIIDSRIKTANAIYSFLSLQTRRPKVFISASAVGFYGDRGNEILTEDSSAGDDFLADVCVQWEKSAGQFSNLGMRTVSVRTAIVLGPGGGMMAKLLPVFKMFLGGTLGNGSQWFSWIHINDLVNVYLESLNNEKIIGPINASSPGVVTNRDFSISLAKALNRPLLFSIPKFVLKIVLGEFSNAVLSSNRVEPRKLNSLGFKFEFPTIDEALKSVVSH